MTKKGGLAQMARKVAAAGIGGDTELAHVTPEEKALLKARGGAKLSQLPLDRLTFHLAGPERISGDAPLPPTAPVDDRFWRMAAIQNDWRAGT